MNRVRPVLLGLAAGAAGLALLSGLWMALNPGSPALGPAPTVHGWSWWALIALLVAEFGVGIASRSWRFDGPWRPRAHHPFVFVGVLAVFGWMGGQAVLRIPDSDLFFHDTYVEVAVLHLTVLAVLMGLCAALSRYAPDPIGWAAWGGLAATAAAGAFGMTRMAAGMVALGVEGMPRNYIHLGTPPIIDAALWGPVLSGGLVWTLGTVAAVGVLGFLAIRARGSSRGADSPPA